MLTQDLTFYENMFNSRNQKHAQIGLDVFENFTLAISRPNRYDSFMLLQVASVIAGGSKCSQKA